MLSRSAVKTSLSTRGTWLGDEDAPRAPASSISHHPPTLGAAAAVDKNASSGARFVDAYGRCGDGRARHGVTTIEGRTMVRV